MSSNWSTSRLGSFFGIGNKHSTKRVAAQKEHVGAIRDVPQHMPPSDYHALHDASYLVVPHDAGGHGLLAQNAPTLPEFQQPNSPRQHYPQSSYTLPDADPLTATSSITLSTSPNARSRRSPSGFNTLQPPPKSRPLLIQTRSHPGAPVPSPFSSPIDHDQNASGYSSICFMAASLFL